MPIRQFLVDNTMYHGTKELNCEPSIKEQSTTDSVLSHMYNYFLHPPRLYGVLITPQLVNEVFQNQARDDFRHYSPLTKILTKPFVHTSSNSSFRSSSRDKFTVFVIPSSILHSVSDIQIVIQLSETPILYSNLHLLPPQRLYDIIDIHILNGSKTRRSSTNHPAEPICSRSRQPHL